MHACHLVGIASQRGGHLAVDILIGGSQTLLVGEDDDQDVLGGFAEVLGHLIGRRHRCGRQRLYLLVLDHLRQRREDHAEHDHQGEPAADHDPWRAYDEATERGKRIPGCLGP